MDDRSDVHETPDGMEPVGIIETTWPEVYDNFEDMHLREELLSGIYDYGFKKPLPIQQRAIIPCVKGRDVNAQAPQDAGKTVTFSIAILQQIDTTCLECQALILSPTRTLATHIQSVVMALGGYMKIHCHACIGGTNVREEARMLQAGCHVVVGTPGRVCDMIKRKAFRTEKIKLIVLDEADKMLSCSFRDQIQNVLKMLPNGLQVVLMSAIMPRKVLKFSQCLMREPVSIFIKEPTHEGIKQLFVDDKVKLHEGPAGVEPVSILVKNKEPTLEGIRQFYVNGGVIETTWHEVYDNFDDMHLREELLRGIYDYGFKTPLAVQQRAIIPCVKGRDVIVQAQSSTGKTATFSIVILQQIDTASRHCQALILAPTHELAKHIQNVVLALGRYMKVHCHAFTDDTKMREESTILQADCHVVVGTPGRVYDMIKRKAFRTEKIKLLVLDEADNMFYSVYRDRIQDVSEMLPNGLQVVLMSAIMLPEVLKLSQSFIRKPVSILIKNEEPTLEGIKQFYVDVMHEVKLHEGHAGVEPVCEIETNWHQVYDNFDDMHLREDLLRGIYGHGIKKPLATQQLAILPCVEGHDVIVQAPSDTGKTATLSIATLQQIDTTIRDCQALILAPTRELAKHIQSVVMALGGYMKVHCHTSTAGTKSREDVLILQAGCHVVVGTPNRVYKLINRKAFRTEKIKQFVIYEAEKILFRDLKYRIQHVLNMLPNDVQVVLMSASMPPEMLKFSQSFMREPVSILFKNVNPILEGIKQFYLDVKHNVCKLIVLNALNEIFSITKSVIFCNTRRMVYHVADEMKRHNFTVSAVYGGMEEYETECSIEQFCSGSSGVLITTDLLAHGIGAAQASFVVNYDLPSNIENYIYRIGRVGRKVVVLNLITDDNRWILKDIETYYHTTIEEMLANVSELKNLYCDRISSAATEILKTLKNTRNEI